MKTIYVGEVRKAFIKDFVADETSQKVVIDDKVSEENILFYKNFFGVVVRLDTGHVYFSRNGAYGYLYDAVKEYGEDCTTLATCEFVNQATFTPRVISNQEFKTLKKAKTN